MRWLRSLWWRVPHLSRLLFARIKFSQPEDSLPKGCQALSNDGVDHCKIGVVIVVDEKIAHSSNLIPRDGWLALEERWIQMLDRFADLHQSHSTRVIDETRLKSIARDVLVDGVDGIEDVVQPLLIVTSHKVEASANTSSLTK